MKFLENIIFIIKMVGFVGWNFILLILLNFWAFLENILLKMGVSYFWLKEIPKNGGCLLASFVAGLIALGLAYVGKIGQIVWLFSVGKWGVKIMLAAAIGVALDYVLFEKYAYLYKREDHSIWVFLLFVLVLFLTKYLEKFLFIKH